MNKKTTTAFLLSKKLIAVYALTAAMALHSCSSGDGSPRLKSFEEKTIHESTQGVITEVEEIEPGDEYKIIDERLIDDKEKSIAIVHTLEGTVDTLALKRIESEKEASHGHFGLRTLLYYSLARSFFSGGSMSNVTPDSRYYKDANAYNKSTGLRSQMQSTATARRVKVPTAASKGYGSSKSFRSFGG